MTHSSIVLSLGSRSTTHEQNMLGARRRRKSEYQRQPRNMKVCEYGIFGTIFRVGFGGFSQAFFTSSRPAPPVLFDLPPVPRREAFPHPLVPPINGTVDDFLFFVVPLTAVLTPLDGSLSLPVIGEDGRLSPASYIPTLMMFLPKDPTVPLPQHDRMSTRQQRLPATPHLKKHHIAVVLRCGTIYEGGLSLKCCLCPRTRPW